jgi:hypothetical protein
LLPAAFRVNAVRMPIPHLTCGDAQRPRWLVRCLGDGYPLCSVVEMRYAATGFTSRKSLCGIVCQKSMGPPTAQEIAAEGVAGGGNS